MLHCLFLRLDVVQVWKLESCIVKLADADSDVAFDVFPSQLETAADVAVGAQLHLKRRAFAYARHLNGQPVVAVGLKERASHEAWWQLVHTSPQFCPLRLAVPIRVYRRIGSQGIGESVCETVGSMLKAFAAQRHRPAKVAVLTQLASEGVCGFGGDDGTGP